LAVTPAHKEAGFTLVEILCVLALLGLTAGLVVLNLPKPAPAFKVEAQNLATLMNVAARQTVIDGKVRGIDLTTGRIDIFQYDGEWVADEASVVADNQLILARMQRPVVGTKSGREEAGGRSYNWQIETLETPQEGLFELSISVSQDDDVFVIRRAWLSDT